jgi:hypothetical protein
MNKWLHGNGVWCQECKATGRGEARGRMLYSGGGYCQFYEQCPACNGQKRIAAAPEMVIAGAVPATPGPAFHTILVQTIEYGTEKKPRRKPRLMAG